jgi:hypothetical protein
VFGAHFTDHYIAFKVLPTIIFFSSFISGADPSPRAAAAAAAAAAAEVRCGGAIV